MTITATDLERIAADWHRLYEVAEPERHAAWAIDLGLVAGDAYALNGAVDAAFSPGNGYSYQLVCYALPGDPRADGECLVSVLNWHRCLVLNLRGMHTPDYLEEKMRIGLTHTVPLAIWLTAFDLRVTELRGGR